MLRFTFGLFYELLGVGSVELTKKLDKVSKSYENDALKKAEECRNAQLTYVLILRLGRLLTVLVLLDSIFNSNYEIKTLHKI